MPTALLYATQLLGMLPALLEAGANIKSLLEHGNATLKAMQDEGRDPTPPEWAELDEKVDALRAQLHG